MITHRIIQFSNIQYALRIGESTNVPVRAVRRSVHGDWKTNIATGNSPAIEVGQTAIVISIWTNFDGDWCTIQLDGATLDVKPTDLHIM